MKKGIRNLENRLERDWVGTVADLEHEGLLVYEFPYNGNLGDYLCEDSRSCITPSTQSNNDECDWLVENGVRFGLDYYTLFGFGEDENGEFVDWNSIECFDFQAFADELGELLKKHNCIMQTHKYKECFIAPKPKCIFHNGYIAVYRPATSFNFKKLDKVIQEIKELAYSHLYWEMTTERREEAKKRLARIHAMQKARRELEAQIAYEEELYGTEIPQKFFDLVKSTISSLASSQGFYERLENSIRNPLTLRSLAFQAMKANAQNSVDIVLMIEG